MVRVEAAVLTGLGLVPLSGATASAADGPTPTGPGQRQAVAGVEDTSNPAAPATVTGSRSAPVSEFLSEALNIPSGDARPSTPALTKLAEHVAKQMAGGYAHEIQQRIQATPQFQNLTAKAQGQVLQ